MQLLPDLATKPREAAHLVVSMVKLGGFPGPRFWRALQKEVRCVCTSLAILRVQ
jgi:hypothetical protein